MNRYLHREVFHSERLGERCTRILHDSGLEIYVYPKNLSTTYALYATRFGSVDSAFSVGGGEFEEVIPGCAHFLEHKMFEEPDGSDAFTAFSALGVDVNAYTTWDRTAYLFSATENEGEALRLLLGFLSRPHFTATSVKKEAGIIAEEIRENDDSPSERCFMNMLRAMYAENSIRKEICGSEASIAQITPKSLYRCYETFYRPENMVLIVCGRLSEEDVLAAVSDALPPSRARIEILRRDENANERDVVSKARVEEQMEVGKPIFLIGVKDGEALRLSPDARMRRDAAMTVLKEMLFSTSGELYTGLLDEGLISPGFAAGYGATHRYAFFEIAGESGDPDEVLRRIRAAIDGAKEKGIDGEAFERARRVLYAKSVKGFDGTQQIAEMLLDDLMSGIPPFRYTDFLSKITPEEVGGLLDTAFQDEYFVLSVISPLSADDRQERRR